MEDIDDDHMLLHEQPMQRTASSSADSEGLYLLPNETLEAVLLHLRSDVLATATQVSHRWRAVAERVLYSNISITEVVSIGSPTPIRTVRACQSVQSRRELQPNVKSFHVRWQSRPGDGPPVQVLEGAFQTHVAPCLLRLHNIESLELSLGGLSRQFVESPNWRLFLDRTFPFVQQLSLTGIGNASVALHSDALPALHRFRGGPGTAAAITPHRPVESLVLVGNDSIPWSDLERLGAASSSLKELDLTHMSVTPLLLRNISKYLSTVEILRLKLALRHTLHFAYSGVVSLVPTVRWANI